MDAVLRAATSVMDSVVGAYVVICVTIHAVVLVLGPVRLIVLVVILAVVADVLFHARDTIKKYGGTRKVFK